MKNKISRTAYYTMGLRAADAAGPRPVCGDTYAKLFFDHEAELVWREFKADKYPNASNAARHRIIDEFVQQQLVANPKRRVVIIGAGFDTRAFRLKGGRWVEVDEPAIIDHKNSRLPVTQTSNELTRVSIEFEHDSLADKLSPFASSDPTVVIVEGVFMYLTTEQKLSLIATLKSAFPNHLLVCDLMRRAFFEKFSRKLHKKILRLGTSFTQLEDEPDRFFREQGYRAREPISIVGTAREWNAIDIPRFVIKLYTTLRKGYEIWVFEAGSPT